MPIPDLPYAYSGPLNEADFRSSWQDFIVDEDLGFEPEGEGEHIYLHLTKRGTNSHWLAQRIAELAGVRPSDVGYCGQKDRHGVTSQWFSVYAPKDPACDWQTLGQGETLDMDLHQVTRGVRKLRRGQHRVNRFEITLRQFSVAPELLQERLQLIQQQGVPNYFGEQRFGHDGNNLEGVAEWVARGRLPRNPQKKSTLISTARSHLFNLILAERVRQNNWREPLAGEATETSTETNVTTGPLWGRGRSAAQEDALALEQKVLADWLEWAGALEHCGLKQERRALVLSPEKLTWEQREQVLTLKFSLPPGQYATVVLREIAQLRNCSLPIDPVV